MMNRTLRASPTMMKSCYSESIQHRRNVVAGAVHGVKGSGVLEYVSPSCFSPTCNGGQQGEWGFRFKRLRGVTITGHRFHNSTSSESCYQLVHSADDLFRCMGRNPRCKHRFRSCDADVSLDAQTRGSPWHRCRRGISRAGRRRLGLGPRIKVVEGNTVKPASVRDGGVPPLSLRLT